MGSEIPGNPTLKNDARRKGGSRKSTNKTNYCNVFPEQVLKMRHCCNLYMINVHLKKYNYNMFLKCTLSHPPEKAINKVEIMKAVGWSVSHIKADVNLKVHLYKHLHVHMGGSPFRRNSLIYLIPFTCPCETCDFSNAFEMRWSLNPSHRSPAF